MRFLEFFCWCVVLFAWCLFFCLYFFVVLHDSVFGSPNQKIGG